MIKKRAKYNQRRKRQQKSVQRKSRRREERLTEPLNREYGRKAILWLDTFISNYRNEPDPEKFDTALVHIDALNLLQIEDHKYTMSAVVATIYRMHPKHQAVWGKKFPNAISRAERLYPEPTELKIKIQRPHQIDQALIDWMVSGDTNQIDAVVELVKESTELGDLAERALSFYIQQFPEVRQHLKQEKPEPFRLDAKQQEQVKELTDIIKNSSDWYKVAMVHYENECFVVATMDGSWIEGLPESWEGCRIECREATSFEVTCYRAWRTRMEDPV